MAPALAALTGVVLIVKLAEVAPAATCTVAGTLAFVCVSVNWTVTPPAGAAAVSVTLPVPVLHPHTVADVRVRVDRAGGVTLRTAVLLIPTYTAEIVAEEAAVTALVLTVKFAVVAPAATRTEAGTVATPVLLLDRVTTAPPAGAGPVNVTLPVEVWVPATVVGVSVTLVSAGGRTDNAAVLVTPA